MKKIITILLFLIPLWCYEQTIEFEFIPTINTNEFSVVNLQKYIREKKIKHPQIVYAQALLETGEFTSVIFKENNNLFGMKYVQDFGTKYTRPTTAVGSKYGHAIYEHWKKSVDDYQLWQQMFKRTPTEKEDEYFTLLKNKYAEDSRYVSHLKIIIQKDTLKW